MVDVDTFDPIKQSYGNHVWLFHFKNNHSSENSIQAIEKYFTYAAQIDIRTKIYVWHLDDIFEVYKKSAEMNLTIGSLCRKGLTGTVISSANPDIW